MEKEELNQIVASYVYDKITPLKTQRIRIKKLYKELREFLGENNCFQTGSYARHTSIRPVNDLDVFYFYEDTTSTDDIGESLSELHENIKENFKSECSEEFETELQTHSVKIQFLDGFSIDVVPAVETGKATADLDTLIYKVPVEDTGEWILSDPKGYKEIAKTTDENSDKNFRRAVRIIKACRKS
jgi:tRNA nucleotidyltransferase (CCA-adding enzyme)